MVHISLPDIVKPKGWLKLARKHKKNLRKIHSYSQKKIYIDANQRIWGSFKDSLKLVSQGKCWFSEAPEGVCHFHVEHFRPKKKIDKYDNSEYQRIDWTIGYWWLTFNWKNYRLVGPSVNSLKSNYFPLFHNSPICATASNHDITKEFTVLLDPTKVNDVKLITYNEWEAEPTEKKSSTNPNYIRAKISIDIYGLNKYPSLNDHRKGELIRFKKLIQQTNSFFNSLRTYELHSDAFNDALDNFNENTTEIKRLINPKNKHAYYTSMNVATLNATGYSWVDKYIF